MKLIKTIKKIFKKKENKKRKHLYSPKQRGIIIAKNNILNLDYEDKQKIIKIKKFLKTRKSKKAFDKKFNNKERTYERVLTFLIEANEVIVERKGINVINYELNNE